MMTMPADPALRIENFSAGYVAKVPIVNDLSHPVPAGRVTTVVGPNGAGKSSLLKGLYGLTRWSKGSVRLDGTELTRLSACERLRAGISLVPQGRCNFPYMTVRENLQLGVATLHRKQRESAVAAALEEFPALRAHLGRMAGNLSGGQQQLLEIAMAMAARPRVLLIDEPSLGLSPAARALVFGKLRQIATTGVCVVMVEQNVVEGLAASDLGIVMVEGRIYRAGTATAIANDPEMKQVFLGGRPDAEPGAATDRTSERNQT
jgi:branched-chain amino acid transport system ATP-binding protein